MKYILNLAEKTYGTGRVRHFHMKMEKKPRHDC